MGMVRRKKEVENKTRYNLTKKYQISLLVFAIKLKKQVEIFSSLNFFRCASMPLAGIHEIKRMPFYGFVCAFKKND